MLVGRNKMKVWGLGLSHNFLRKVKGSHLFQGVIMQWELRWC
jgi:hypothetical protein